MAVPGAPKMEEDAAFPTGQLVTLALCRIAEPIAFTSILAYTYVMVKDFFQHGDDTNASFYAGLLVSAFAVAEMCTAMIWGTISDRYGRKPIILVGLAGTALSSLVFGFATNIWMALGARVIGGLLNGNVAVMQTMVAELCTRPEFEPKAYAMPPFMWSLGSIFGAAMGGYLAEPSKYYPSVFPADGLFGKYPYLLPNLVAVAFIMLAIIQGYFFLKETNPRFNSPSPHESGEDIEEVTERTPLQQQAVERSVAEDHNNKVRRPSFASGSMPTMSEPTFDLRKGSVTSLYGIKRQTPVSHTGLATSRDNLGKAPKVFNRRVTLLIIAIVIMCYHQMAFGSVLPVYLLDTPVRSDSFNLHGGLGYTVHDVGGFMSVNGMIALLIQLVIFPTFVARVGVWRSLVVLTTISPIAYAFVPFLSLLPRPDLPFGIYAILIVENFFLIIIYPCLLIELKNAAPSPLVLGKINGLAMSASSGARTIAPPLCGVIYSVGGSAIAWWSIMAMAIVGAFEFFWISRPTEEATIDVENVLRRQSNAVLPTVRIQEEVVE